jgi:signal transduction histidine kinase
MIGKAEEYFPKVYSSKRKINDKALVHDARFNRFIEISRSSILSGGVSQIRISKDIDVQSGTILSFPFPIEDILSTGKESILIAVSGQHSRIMHIKTNGKIIATDSLSFPRGRDTVHFIHADDSIAFVRFGDNIFSLRFGIDSIITQNLASQVLAVESHQNGFHCISRSAGGLIIRSFNTHGDIKKETPFSPMGSIYAIQSTKNAILVLSTATGESTNGFLLDLRTGKQEMLFFPGSLTTTVMWEKDEKPVLSWISEDEKGINTISIQQQGKQTNTLTLPNRFTDALTCRIIDNSLYCLFSDGICEIDIESNSLESASPISSMRVFASGNPYIIKLNDEYVITMKNGYMFLEMTPDPLWWLRRFIATSGAFLIPGIILLIIIIFYRRYLLQRRFLEAGLELSGMGILIYLDSEGRLIKVNSTAKSVLHISPDIPLHRPIRYYVSKSHLSELLDFIETALIERKPMQKQITIGENETVKEFIWGATPLFGFAGSFAGCILSGIDITEELEKKRLTNWAQLAHDMQTNLSIILLNAQQLQIVDEKNIIRQKKILSQITLLMQRVRDIVTVGREEIASYSPNDALLICKDVIEEFDDQLYPNAKLSFSGKPIMLFCDPIKLTRGLRNAVENGMRALQKQPGTVDLSCSHDDRFVYFKIKDSGIGMDDHTRANMMKPYFTTKNSQGGYGIGTMVMQKVAELHNGRIEIGSEPGKGSVITFIIPLLTSKPDAS